MSSLTNKTLQIYASAQAQFAEWLEIHNHELPADDEMIARYLRSKLFKAPTTIPVHLSAIANLYRRNKWPLDVKAPPIFRITQKAKNGH